MFGTNGKHAARIASPIFLDTAYHEAGHAVFDLRQSSLVKKIHVNVKNPKQGCADGGTTLAPMAAAFDFAAGGKFWLKWKRRAFLWAAECIAGPLVEMMLRRNTCPDCCWAAAWEEPYLANDIIAANTIIEEWYQTVCGEVDGMHVSNQMDAVERYVKTALRGNRMRQAIDRIVALLVENNGSVGGELLCDVEIPRVYLRTSYLDFPPS